MLGIKDWSDWTFASCSGYLLKALIPPLIEFLVVSFPATISNKTLPRNSLGDIFLVASPLASIEIRSPPPWSLALRSSQTELKYSKHFHISWNPSSGVSKKFGSEILSTVSDQWINFNRSSCGTSNKVANILLVNSIDTSETQLKLSPSGKSSRILLVLPLISSSNVDKCAPVNIGATSFLCPVCLGWSCMMNIGKWNNSSGGSDKGCPPKRIPPFIMSEENLSWSISTAFTSS